jgi:hypothetical protein
MSGRQGSRHRCARVSISRAAARARNGYRCSPQDRCRAPRCRRRKSAGSSRHRTRPAYPTGIPRAWAPGYPDATLRHKSCANWAAAGPQPRRHARWHSGTWGWRSCWRSPRAVRRGNAGCGKCRRIPRHASLRRHYPHQVQRVSLTPRHPPRGPLRVMLTVMKLWDNCKSGAVARSRKKYPADRSPAGGKRVSPRPYMFIDFRNRFQ